MASFFNKLKPGVAATNTTNNVSPNKKNNEAVPELTPLEKMLQNVGPLRDDGTDKFFGLENFGNTCYCNSIVQALYYSEIFRENVIRFPPYSPSGTPNGTLKKVNVQIRPPLNSNAEATTPGSLAAAGDKKPTVPTQPPKQKPPINQGPTPNGQPAVRPEDKPETPEYKKKQAMIKGPVLELAQENSGAYGMDESTFTGLKDIFMAFIESNSRTGVLSPLRFLELFRQANESFKTAMHQDAHEFYGLVLNDVIKDVEAASLRLRELDMARPSQDDLKQSVEAVLGANLLTSYDGTSTPGSGWVHDIFEGVLTSETRCLTCETSSQRDETFLDLSIDLEEHSSVTSCLRKFSAEEMLCERDKFHCDNCGGLQEAEKRMKIKRLPKILALHLKRFKYAENYTKLEKLFHRVVYPYQLRMFNTTDDARDPDRLYELYAVVIHIGGNAYHGHYVSVIKTKEYGWLLFDDEMVEPVDKHYVRNFFGDKPGTACAYVLFYQETTFEKVQAEQEAEGLEEIKLASQSAGLALSPETINLGNGSQPNGNHATLNGAAGEQLARQSTQPVLHAVDDRDELVNLEHAQTAPGAVLTPTTSVAVAPALPIGTPLGVPTGMAPVTTASATATVAAAAAATTTTTTTAERTVSNAKAEAARLKEEKERLKKEAKAAEKARKLQEKETAKEAERQRKEREAQREAQRKAEAEEMKRVLAASRQTAADEKEARKNSLDGTLGSGSTTVAGTVSAKTTSFLNRGARGSKSMSRKSFGFLGKDKNRHGHEALHSGEHSGTNGTANGVNVSTGHLHMSSSPPEPLPPQQQQQQQQQPEPIATEPLADPTTPPVPDMPLQHAHTHAPGKTNGRFSFSLGRKKSNVFFT